MSDEIDLFNVRVAVLNSSGRVLETPAFGSFKFEVADRLARVLRRTALRYPGREIDVSLIPCRKVGDERKKGGRDGER